jgi:hypothetical protein
MSGTLFVAVVALALSAASLTWQLALYALSGSRPRVELLIGATDGFGIVSGPAGSEFAPQDLNLYTSQGFSEPLAGVRVRNRGRLAVSVTSWGIGVGGGFTVSLPGYAINRDAPIPYRLEPGAQASWYLPLSDVLAAMRAAAGQPYSLRAQASLGDGREIRGHRVSLRNSAAA